MSRAAAALAALADPRTSAADRRSAYETVAGALRRAQDVADEGDHDDGCPRVGDSECGCDFGPAVSDLARALG